MSFFKIRLLLLPILFLGVPLATLAQEKCGTVEYEKIRRQINPALESIDQFEQWIGKLIQQNKLRQLNGERLQAQSYTIPVVIHVIHNGEQPGTGSNISDAQIISQMNVINTDFKRLNKDTTLTPTEFKSVASGIDITFVLAKQDPEGLPTNGILRVKGSQTSWSPADNATFKALSYWPAEDY